MKAIEQELVTKIILETATYEDFIHVGDSYTYFEDLFTRDPVHSALREFGITNEVKNLSFGDRAFTLYPIENNSSPDYIYGVFKYTGDPITFFHRGQILTAPR